MIDVCEPQPIESEGGLDFGLYPTRLAVLFDMAGIALMGGQGKRPNPRPKIRGTQDRNKWEKRKVVPQPPKPPKKK